VKTVFVGLSGGVDSAVSAYLLKKDGYRIVGAFIKAWEPPFLPCTGARDRLEAMRVAAHLEIPFVTYDLSEEYKREVVDSFIEEYRVGRTPNPDVLCNRSIKFGSFWERARADGADFIATGHYAVSESREKSFELRVSKDKKKDQTYFLWTLHQDDLAHSLFPVGGLEKNEVRKIAAQARLPNALRKDSQGLCFLGHVDMKDFLLRYVSRESGAVINAEGSQIGTHDGLAFYTVGERFPGQGPEKLYVVAKNRQENTLTVSRQADLSALGYRHFEIEQVNWIRTTPEPGRLYGGQVRYHGDMLEVTVNLTGTATVVDTSVPVLAAEGQSLVIYDTARGECMGGGIISVCR